MYLKKQKSIKKQKINFTFAKNTINEIYRTTNCRYIKRQN
jgi:hypothetical protein